MTADQDRRNSEPTDDGDLVGQLIRSAGRRPSPPEAAYRKALEAATAALSMKLAARRRRQWTLALAASLAVAFVAAGLFYNRPEAPVEQVARLDRVSGAMEWSPRRGAAWQPLRGESARADRGGRLRSGAGSRAGMVLANGASVRIAGETELEFESAVRLTLRQGKVYVDTGAPDGGNGSVEIVTLAGTVRDVGTQFEVAYGGDDYRLRTREGRVLLERGTLEASVEAGEEIFFTGNGPLRHSRIAPDDPDWLWIQDVAPAPDIDGQPVRVLLDWVARETGRTVRYANPGVEQMAGRTTLHGTIPQLVPLDALAVMLATTDLAHELQSDGTILITSKPAPEGVL